MGGHTKMPKLLIIADIHIKLGQKNVPSQWQYNRFMLLAMQLQAIIKSESISYLVIAGDLLDSAKPTLQEIGLLYDFLRAIPVETLLIPGNHEMINKSDDCYLHLFDMLKDLNVFVINDFFCQDGVDYIPYNILKHKEWPDSTSKFCVTHVRGEIPPHVAPEIDLDKFSKYDKVFAGDLHSYTNSQKNILYPGSPFTTSFHRSVVTGSNGYFIFDTETGEHTWNELFLPQLIRKTVASKEEIVPTQFHHTVYELEGSLEELKNTESSDLLDKKITRGLSAPPKLEMSGTISDELATYLVEVKGIESPSKYVEAFIELVPNEN